MQGSTLYVLDGQGYVAEPVDDGLVRLWRRTGQTKNPRVVANADGASLEGVMHSVHVEDGLVLLQHWNGGIMHWLHGRERIVPAAVTYELVEPVFDDGGGEL